MTYEEILQAIEKEVDKATTLFGPFNSNYEGYAVILEEVEELWDEIKKKSHERSIPKMREEAIQIAAMAFRFLIDRQGWTKEDVIACVRDSHGDDHKKIFTHHDGYGRLLIKMECLWNSIVNPDHRTTRYPPALSLVLFMDDFIFDTMNGEYKEKFDDETFGHVLAESALGR